MKRAVTVGYRAQTVNKQDFLSKETTPKIQLWHHTSDLFSHYEVINTDFPFITRPEPGTRRPHLFARSCVRKHDCARLSRELNSNGPHRWPDAPAKRVQFCCRRDEACAGCSCRHERWGSSFRTITSCLMSYFSWCDAEAPWFPDLYSARYPITRLDGQRWTG